jgi:hypothetical protein
MILKNHKAANAYLREHFIPDYDAQFTCPPADPDPAFVALGTVDLALILCHEEERTVGLDNVVVLEGVPLQLAKQPGRRTCARLRVTVRRHLDGTHSVWRGPQCLGRYEATGAPLVASTPRRSSRPRAHRLTAPRRRPTPSLALPSPRLTRPRRGPRLPMGPRT